MRRVVLLRVNDERDSDYGLASSKRGRERTSMLIAPLSARRLGLDDPSFAWEYRATDRTVGLLGKESTYAASERSGGSPDDGGVLDEP